MCCCLEGVEWSCLWCILVVVRSFALVCTEPSTVVKASLDDEGSWLICNSEDR